MPFPVFAPDLYFAKQHLSVPVSDPDVQGALDAFHENYKNTLAELEKLVMRLVEQHETTYILRKVPYRVVVEIERNMKSFLKQLHLQTINDFQNLVNVAIEFKKKQVQNTSISGNTTKACIDALDVKTLSAMLDVVSCVFMDNYENAKYARYLVMRCEMLVTIKNRNKLFTEIVAICAKNNAPVPTGNTKCKLKFDGDVFRNRVKAWQEACTSDVQSDFANMDIDKLSKIKTFPIEI
eukprot:gene19697-26388_t